MKTLKLKAAISISLCLVLGTPTLSFADILFMDLNNNPKEIEAAQRAATKRGEKLVVIPKRTAAQKTAAAAALRTLYQAQENERRACQDYRTTACREASHASDVASQSYQSTRVDFRKDDLKKELADLTKNKVQLSSLIISGHDGNGDFNGSNGNFSDRDIKEAFDEYPELGSSIRSLLLWGCYTTNIGSLEKNWKNVLPNVTLVAGFDGSAPLGDKPANWGYLEDVLVKEKVLTAATDQKTMKSIFNSIRGINMVTSSICLNQDDVITSKGIKSIKKEYAECKDLQSGAITNKFQCYEKAEPGCEDVPSVTSSGPLRELYNKIQSSKHCHEILSTSVYLPTGDATIRLIFDKQVRKNFETQNREGLEVLNGLIKENGLPDKLQFKDLDKLTRRQFIDQIKAVEKAIGLKADGIKDELGRLDDPSLLALSTALEPVRSLSYVSRSSGCVPFEWVEPFARSRDRCDWSKQMQNASETGAYYATSVQVQRSDEAAELTVIGPTIIETKQRLADVTKRYRELVEKNAPMDELKNVMNEYTKSTYELYSLQSQAAPKIAQERVNFYTEKIKTLSNSNSVEKKIYQQQLTLWQQKLQNKTDGGGIINGNGFGAGMMAPSSGR